MRYPAIYLDSWRNAEMSIAKEDSGAGFKTSTYKPSLL